MLISLLEVVASKRREVVSMKKYILIGLGILSVTLFLITAEVKAATFMHMDRVATEGEDCEGGNPLDPPSGKHH